VEAVQRCLTCNAPLEDPLAGCRFCGAMTPEAVAAAKERARADEALRIENERRLAAEAASARQRAEAEQRAARFRLQAEVNGAGTQAIVWSLVSMLCCLPIGPIVGLILSRRARAQASAGGLNTGHATLGFAVSLTCLALSLSAWAGAGVSIKMESNHKAELRAQVERGAFAQELSGTNACTLAELELLDSKYEGYNWLNHDFSCDGKVVPAGEGSLVRGHFTKEGQRIDVVACLEHGERWVVSQLRGDDACDQPPPTAARRQEKRGNARGR
jgi:hypothetical protein